jgi:N-methylhydantoinase A
MRLATDTGGTFTDLVVEEDDGTIALFKALTVPDDPVRGVLDALAKGAEAYGETLTEFLGRAESFIHGTTHAINAIITGNTAKTALFVTEGHRDILTLREGGRAEAFDRSAVYPKPYIPRALTFAVPERLMWDGSIHKALDESAVCRAIEAILSQDVRAVAVCLLWSIINPLHEKRVGQLLATHAPHVEVTLSHALNPTPREYRRANSAAIDASLKPIMTRYIVGLKERLAAAGFDGRVLVLTSRGGMLDADEAARTPIQMINSGPSVAPVAGRRYAMAEGARTAIVADTGGTTYDVGLIRDGVIPITREMWIGKPMNGHLVGFPAVDMRSVGAGGGSIAWVDVGGLLHVGPHSAGAQPGPACYGRGGRRATMSDAALVLGFIDPNFFLGGAIVLDHSAAHDAIVRDVAEPLGVDVVRAATAIIEVATENMVQAIVDITVAQGVDPADSVLIGGGGAAGLNALYIARRLGVKHLLVPETGATLSAAGALLSDLTAEFSAVAFATTRKSQWDHIGDTLDLLKAKCRAFADGPGAGAVESSVTIVAEARYENQVWEIDVPIDSDGFGQPDAIQKFRSDFDQAHKKLFTVDDPRSVVEIVAFRASVRSRLSRNSGFRLAVADVNTDTERGTRRVHFPGQGVMNTPVRRLEVLPEGEMCFGPAILESPFTTVVIDPQARYIRQPSGSLAIFP